MHEFGMCESFLDAVTRRADGRPVAAVRMRVGALHRVDEPSLRQAFELVAAGTVADGAAVELVTTPVVVSCAACGVRTDTGSELPAACPACDATGLEIVGGDELILEWLRLAADGAAAEAGEAVPPEPDDGHTHDGHPHRALPTAGA